MEPQKDCAWPEKQLQYINQRMLTSYINCSEGHAHLPYNNNNNNPPKGAGNLL